MSPALLFDIFIAVGSAITVCLGFYTWVRIQISQLKTELYYIKKIYKDDLMKREKAEEKVYSKLKELFEGQNEMRADLKILKYKQGINGK